MRSTSKDYPTPAQSHYCVEGAINEELIGVLTLIYVHHHNDLVNKKMDIEHDSDVTIICTNHVHIDHYNCLETISLRGEAEKIERFADRIAGLKGVKFAKLTKAAVPKF